MSRTRILGTSVALAGAYLAVVRPRLLRWGATDEEVRRPFPGADVIAGGRRGATMAVTIGADGFSYTRPDDPAEGRASASRGSGAEPQMGLPSWKQGEYKLGHQL